MENIKTEKPIEGVYVQVVINNLYIAFANW